MYSLKQIKKGIKNPKYIYNEIWRLHSELVTWKYNRNYPPFPDKDWDNLIILDACRYDLFESNNSLPGELSEYYSNASNTAEYVRKTFKGKEFNDIVLVTSTPKYYKPYVEDSFHDVINVWRDKWDEEDRTVLPEDMSDSVLEASKKYPNKRILAHYIPPHVPLIGETGKEIPHQVVFSKDVIRMDTDKKGVFDQLRDGDIDEEKIWKAYKENLEIVLPEVESVMKELEGKTVITSDHGNAFGHLNIYGHPAHRHIKPLIKVPWLEYQNGERKTIIEEEREINEEDIDEEKVKDRLADLGYTS